MARNTADKHGNTNKWQNQLRRSQTPTTRTTTRNCKLSHTTIYPNTPSNRPARRQHRLQRRPHLSGHWHQNSSSKQQTWCKQSERQRRRRTTCNRQHASNQPHSMQTCNCPHTQGIRLLFETRAVWQPRLGQPQCVWHVRGDLGHSLPQRCGGDCLAMPCAALSNCKTRPQCAR